MTHALKAGLLVGSLLAGALGGVAQAQTTDWSGPYVGAVFGYAKTDATKGEQFKFDKNLDGQFNDTVNTATGANAFSPGFCDGAARTSLPTNGCVGDDDENWELGVRAGYDLQFGAFVVGAVAEVERVRIQDRVSAFSTTPAFYTLDRKLKAMGAVRLRAGYAMGPYLGYVTGGVARGQIKHAFTTSNAANTFVRRDSDNANGTQFGLGLERQLDGKVRLGLEYLQTRLDDDGYTVRVQGPAPATNPFILTNAAGTDLRRTEDDMKIHSVRLTASYRF